MTKIKKTFWKIAALATLAAPVTVMAQVPGSGSSTVQGGGFNPGAINDSGANLSGQSIFNIIKTFMLWILGLLGFLAVIGFVISGIMYLVAAGDEDAQKRAKRAMYYSITGVIVGLIGLIILLAVSTLLKGNNAEF